MAHGTVALVDYGVGNLGSVRNMFKRIGAPTKDINRPEQLAGCTHVLLPGVGSFDHGVKTLQSEGWIEAIRDYASTGNALLGICLGMQLLLDSSEEGVEHGLGLIPGNAIRFASQTGLRVPHMGWNFAEPVQQNQIFKQVESDARYYFVHSYYAVTESSEHTIASTEYGIRFSSVISKGNVYGMQFHPEKSHRFGMQLLKNFSEL